MREAAGRRHCTMAPLGKPRDRSSSSSNVSDLFADAQQSGRSSTSLHAEVAAAAIARESQRPHSQGVVGSPSFPVLARANSIHSLPSASSTASPVILPPANNPPSHTPNVSSPLNPNCAASISSQSSADRLSSDEQSSTSSTAPKGAVPQQDSMTRRVPPKIPPPRRPRRGRLQEMSESKAAYRTSVPMSIQELGSDYTRYFNPFSDSRRASYVDLGGSTTPLPRYNSPGPEQSLLLKRSGVEKAPVAAAQPINEKAIAPFFPFLDDRLAAPFGEKGGIKFPLFASEKEDDDDMHMPMPDDDLKYRTRFKDYFARDMIVSTFGFIFMTLGLLFVFVLVPILSFTGIFSLGIGQTPLDQMWHPPGLEAWAIVNNKTYPLLSNIRTGLIDPDTPHDAYSRTDINGQTLELVFSDEFNDNNRTFYEGDDPYWFAPDIWYGATIDLDWYDPDAVTTYNGVLELRLDKFPNHGVQYRSGMLNSWNQLCFKGGVFEVSVSLPGPAGVPAFWPGAWTMGNLGRPGYLSTTDGMWPYTYNDCDAGITPNQSMSDGTSRLPGQRLNSCTCPGEDHPTPGTGRGAPEIDIFEAASNLKGLGVVTQSYQVAPFDVWYYPDYEFTEFPDYTVSYPNTYTGGPYQQALSATTYLNNDWYDGKQYQKYAFEYKPGQGSNAYIAWYVGEDMSWMLNGNAIGPNGNIGYRQISEEPMSIVLNLGFSTAWTYIDYEALTNAFPAVMRVDYVRWYQPKGNHSITCDPPGYETTEYIKAHPNAYANPNLTLWNETGFNWPKNKLTSDC